MRTASTDSSLVAEAGGSYRGDVQGLRAVAVLLVVVYHLWPGRLSGGFVGVDVFFVISGYLITRHLVDEVERHGRLRVVRFWARRARRLLPASLLVLLVSLVMVWAWVPQTGWADTVRQTAASALYVQNWVLAADAVDYSASGASATVAQHYWSLSVEEQFYVVWPLLIGLLMLLRSRATAHRGRARPVRRVVTIALAAVALASLAWSVVATQQDQGVAYFATTTRVWEFAVGGLLGTWWAAAKVPARVGVPLAWLGLLAIGVAAVTFDHRTAFPGWVALLPVLGTTAVLAGGHLCSRWGPRWLTWRPATFVGDISYAVYLWHWPLIVVAPFALAAPIGVLDRLGIVALSLVLAWASTRWVENPLRTGSLLRPPWRALAAGAVGMAVVVTAATGLRALLPEDRVYAVPSAAGCVGPGALDPANRCPSVMGRGPLRPGPVQVSRENRDDVAYPGCLSDFAGSALRSCDLGDPNGERTVAIVGDSHAYAWFPAMDELGRRLGWKVLTFAKTSCPVSLARRVLPNETTTAHQRDCAAWVRALDVRLRTDDRIDAVFTASYSTAYTFESPDDHTFDDPATEGFTTLWRGWHRAGREVVAFADVPRTNGGYVPDCLAAHPGRRMACAVERSRALPARRPITDAGHAARGDARLLDLTDRFCGPRWCYPVVGSMIVYRDYSHLSREFARALAPVIEERLPKSLVGTAPPVAARAG